jgi:hypothetical protein
MTESENEGCNAVLKASGMYVRVKGRMAHDHGALVLFWRCLRPRGRFLRLAFLRIYQYLTFVFSFVTFLFYWKSRLDNWGMAISILFIET